MTSEFTPYDPGKDMGQTTGIADAKTGVPEEAGPSFPITHNEAGVSYRISFVDSMGSGTYEIYFPNLDGTEGFADSVIDLGPNQQLAIELDRMLRRDLADGLSSKTSDASAYRIAAEIIDFLKKRYNN